MPVRYVLDSFALLALFQEERGAVRVQELLAGAREGEHELYMSVVNLGEVVYTVENRRGLEASQEALAAADQLPIEIVEVDRPLALSAARLKATSGIGYADCFAAALAQRLAGAIVTGDLDFQQIEHSVAIEWLPAADAE
jgi:ribonuclease VapC